MQVKPIPRTSQRAGTLLLELAQANFGTGTAPGERSYNWANKLTFALSAGELGSIVAGRPIPFDTLHDPGKGGEVRQAASMLRPILMLA